MNLKINTWRTIMSSGLKCYNLKAKGKASRVIVYFEKYIIVNRIFLFIAGGFKDGRFSLSWDECEFLVLTLFKSHSEQCQRFCFSFIEFCKHLKSRLLQITWKLYLEPAADLLLRSKFLKTKFVLRILKHIWVLCFCTISATVELFGFIHQDSQNH